MITPPMLDFCHYLQSASGILACLWSFKASLWQLEGLAERRILRCQNLQSIATRNTSVSFGSVEITIWIYRRGTMNPIGLIIRSPWSPHRHHNSTPSQSLSGGTPRLDKEKHCENARHNLLSTIRWIWHIYRRAEMWIHDGCVISWYETWEHRSGHVTSLVFQEKWCKASAVPILPHWNQVSSHISPQGAAPTSPRLHWWALHGHHQDVLPRRFPKVSWCPQWYHRLPSNSLSETQYYHAPPRHHSAKHQCLTLQFPSLDKLPPGYNGLLPRAMGWSGWVCLSICSI